MSADYDALLLKHVRENARRPASWFGCALDIAFTLPVLFAEVKRGEAALASGNLEHGRMVLAPARSFTLLAGYAAENFVKGLWVARALGTGRSLAPAGDGVLHSRLQQHDLDVLAKEADLRLGRPALKTLRQLHKAILWWAKYPVPTKSKGFELFGTGTGEAERIREVLRHLEQLARAYCLDENAAWPPDASTVKAEW